MLLDVFVIWFINFFGEEAKEEGGTMSCFCVCCVDMWDIEMNWKPCAAHGKVGN